MQAQCKSCIFFQFAKQSDGRGKVSDSNTTGVCKHDSPKIFMLDGRPRTMWPMVKTVDFCGQHSTVVVE